MSARTFHILPNETYAMRENSLISRRKMIAASGIVISGLSQVTRQAVGQQRELAAGQPIDAKELLFRTTDPRNGEPELKDLVQSWMTPTKHFYVRSHAPNPEIDPTQFRLSLTGLVEREVTLSLADLKKLPEHTITATLTCAGNRRKEFNKQAPVGGVQWESGAIGNAQWTGVKLSDVLQLCGVKPTAEHVWFDGQDKIDYKGETINFGASIPIAKALGDDKDIGALVTYGMNGSELSADHGYPLRTVVPGYIGARSVKWLNKITLSDRPSTNHYVATAYKVVTDTQPLNWEEAGPLYRYPINAAIALEEDAKIQAGKVQLSGYVLPSGISGASVSKVLVSADQGKTWTEAELTGKDENFCWQLWKAEVHASTETKQFIVRASDSQGSFMPARVPWNAKGYMQNSWYRLNVQVN